MRRFALAAVAAVLGFCLGGCSGLTEAMSIGGTYEWMITSDPGCPLPPGVLTGGSGSAHETFTISQTGSNWSASFTDSSGNSVSMSGTYAGGVIRGTFTIDTPGGRALSGRIEGTGFLRDNGQTEIDGNVIIEADSDGTCTGYPVSYWAMTPTAAPQVLEICPPVDVLFVMDTSGSMDDEAEALCTEISGVEADLRARGLTDLRVRIYGMTETEQISETGAFPRPGFFFCLTNTVYRAVGGNGVDHPVVPGDPPGPTTITNSDNLPQFIDPTVMDPFNPEQEELWAPTVAVAAQNYDWLDDPSPTVQAVRLIVVISDESPQSGDSVCYPVDTAAIQNAIGVANANDVIVSVIIGFDDDRDVCIQQLAQTLATGTGGVFVLSEDASDIGASIDAIVEQACSTVIGTG